MSVVIIKTTEKYFTKVIEIFTVDNVKGSPVDSVVGMPDNKLVKVSTKRVDKENKRGAPTETAKNIKITYIKTFEAALFSTKPLSLIFTEVCSNNVAIFPPALIPERIKSIVLLIFSEFILLDISNKASSTFFPVAISLPVFSISWSKGLNSFLALRSIDLSMVIPALKLLDIN